MKEKIMPEVKKNTKKSVLPKAEKSGGVNDNASDIEKAGDQQDSEIKIDVNVNKGSQKKEWLVNEEKDRLQAIDELKVLFEGGNQVKLDSILSKHRSSAQLRKIIEGKVKLNSEKIKLGDIDALGKEIKSLKKDVNGVLKNFPKKENDPEKKRQEDEFIARKTYLANLLDVGKKTETRDRLLEIGSEYYKNLTFEDRLAKLTVLQDAWQTLLNDVREYTQEKSPITEEVDQTTTVNKIEDEKSDVDTSESLPTKDNELANEEGHELVSAPRREVFFGNHIETSDAEDDLAMEEAMGEAIEEAVLVVHENEESNDFSETSFAEVGQVEAALDEATGVQAGAENSAESAKKRKTVFEGLASMGFKTTEIKSRVLGNFCKAVGESGKLKDNVFGKFFSQNVNIFKKREDLAIRMQDTGGKGAMTKVSGVGQGFGNVMRTGRLIYDVVGHSMVNPLRYVTMGGMFAGQVMEATKEVRLSNKEVQDKTVIEKENEAYDEAWRLYNQTEALVGKKGKVTKDELEKVYREKLPEDLKKR